MQYKYKAMQFAAMQYKLCKCALQRKLCWQREAACPASEACDHRDHLLHHLQWPTDDAAGDGDDDEDGDDHDHDHADDDDEVEKVCMCNYSPCGDDSAFQDAFNDQV